MGPDYKQMVAGSSTLAQMSDFLHCVGDPEETRLE